MQGYDPTNEFVVLDKFIARSAYQVALPTQEERDTEIRNGYVEGEAEERHSRLTSPDLWGSDFQLASPYALLWNVK